MYTTRSSSLSALRRIQVPVGALAGAAATTITVNDQAITPNSHIIATPAGGTTVPAAGATAILDVSPRVPTSGSVVIDVRNNAAATATLSTDYVINLLIVPLVG